mmetsp:Transcript_14752/g.40335  ORF Transcript_14752/g.40335 Transcript_14752/m.40335 type:complete len:115 (+) Transcript_14752:1083-1427(+)
MASRCLLVPCSHISLGTNPVLSISQSFSRSQATDLSAGTAFKILLFLFPNERVELGLGLCNNLFFWPAVANQGIHLTMALFQIQQPARMSLSLSKQSRSTRDLYLETENPSLCE